MLPRTVALVALAISLPAEAFRVNTGKPLSASTIRAPASSAPTSPQALTTPLHEVLMGASVATGLGFAAPVNAEAADAWVAPTAAVLGPLVNIALLMFLVRTVLSWYPSKNLNKLPWNIVAWPTEPVLAATRKVVPPAFGVDVSPIVWIFILSFINETLLGPQGLFTIMLSK